MSFNFSDKVRSLRLRLTDRTPKMPKGLTSPMKA